MEKVAPAVGTLVYAFPRYGNGENTFFRVKEHRTARVIILERLATARTKGYVTFNESGHTYCLERPICVTDANVRATVSKEWGWSVHGAAKDGADREILSDTPLQEGEVFTQTSYY
jgi:hypothetical protein